MIREIVKDTFFLSQKSELATRQDLSGVGELSNLSTSMSNIAQVISDGFQA